MFFTISIPCSYTIYPIIFPSYSVAGYIIYWQYGGFKGYAQFSPIFQWDLASKTNHFLGFPIVFLWFGVPPWNVSRGRGNHFGLQKYHPQPIPRPATWSCPENTSWHPSWSPGEDRGKTFTSKNGMMILQLGKSETRNGSKMGWSKAVFWKLWSCIIGNFNHHLDGKTMVGHNCSFSKKGAGCGHITHSILYKFQLWDMPIKLNCHVYICKEV